MLDDVHAMHGRFMISVWPKFYTNTDHYKELKEAGYAYTHAEDTGLVDWLNHPQSFYDAYAEGGRKMFWRQMDETLYSKYGKKIDAWWMDASEPNLRDCLPWDYFKWLLTPTALGPSTEYFTAYSLVNADAIYNGQREVNPDTRVFLLTRNGFAGLQRYSTASWSGDIGTSWEDMRMQMAAGLGYSMAGLPMWGMDIGGFSVMSKFYNPANRPEWQELQTRWHQFGTFVPLFRTHGQAPARELWNIADEGSEAYESILWYMRLRYRLMPYIYSLAGAVHFDDYTIMRGLPMDFPDDPEVRDLSDQWLFGPALMPAPVYEYQARSRGVYFPAGGWYDFYSGAYLVGGGLHHPLRPCHAVVRREARGRHPPRRLCRQGRLLQPLRGRERELQLREGLLRQHPHLLGRGLPHAHHRRAQGLLRRHAPVPHLPRRRGRPGHPVALRPRRPRRSGPVRWQTRLGEVISPVIPGLPPLIPGLTRNLERPAEAEVEAGRGGAVGVFDEEFQGTGAEADGDGGDGGNDADEVVREEMVFSA